MIKSFTEFDIKLVQCVGNAPGTNETHQSLNRSEQASTSNQIRMSTPENSENQTLMSEKYATSQNGVSRHTRKERKIAGRQSTGDDSSDSDDSGGKEMRKSLRKILFGLCLLKLNSNSMTMTVTSTILTRQQQQY